MSIVTVDPLFVGTEYETEVWSSLQVVAELEKLVISEEQNAQRVFNKLDYLAKAGFRSHEGKQGLIRSEGDGAWRIGLWGDLFRILGFYTSDRKDEFVAIEAFGKRGQRLVKQERKRVKSVARIKREGLWEKTP